MKTSYVEGPPPRVQPPRTPLGRTPLGHFLWHPLWFNSSVEVLGYDTIDSTDSQAKVGCVIAIRVSYMFTTFYLISETLGIIPPIAMLMKKKICLTPLDVPSILYHWTALYSSPPLIRMHPGQLSSPTFDLKSDEWSTHSCIYIQNADKYASIMIMVRENLIYNTRISTAIHVPGRCIQVRLHLHRTYDLVAVY